MNTDVTDSAAPTRAKHAQEMAAYGEEGLRRARAIGNRGPVRFNTESAEAIFGQRLVRWATPREREETLNLSAILVTVGFVLIVIGLALDPRYSLF